MEIHAPESPVNSFKDFLVHISIVTVGILIALGLDGLRETIHNRHLVRETRENVHTEMGFDQDHAALECQRVIQYRDSLKALVDAMPAVAQRSGGELQARLNVDRNPGYILGANSWDAALSTGVLAHIPTGEVAAYAYGAEGMRTYAGLQTEARNAEAHAKAFVAAHPHPSADQVAQEMEDLLLFYNAQDGLAYFCPQMQGDVARAYRASAH